MPLEHLSDSASNLVVEAHVDWESNRRIEHSQKRYSIGEVLIEHGHGEGGVRSDEFPYCRGSEIQGCRCQCASYSLVIATLRLCERMYERIMATSIRMEARCSMVKRF